MSEAAERLMVCVQLEAFVLEKYVVVVLGDFPVWLSSLKEASDRSRK